MRLSIEVTPEEHRKIKTMAALSGMKIKDWVLGHLLNKKPEKSVQRRYNKATEKAIDDARKGKNLLRYESLEAMFKDLGIR